MKVPRMRIPVFVSAPSIDNLSPKQERSAEIIQGLLEKHKLEWRGLGRSDYPTGVPLREVRQMVRHCSGGIILGFEQFRATRGVWRPDSGNQKSLSGNASFPTPWNNLEAGILFGAALPMMIFREGSVGGGVFDDGSTEIFVHRMPDDSLPPDSLEELDAVFDKWVAQVRTHYYDE